MSGHFQVTTFDAGEGPVVGLVRDGGFYASQTFSSVREILDRWDLAEEKLTTAAARMAERTPLRGVRVLAPLPNPRNIYFTGANYADHLEEMARVLGPAAAAPREPWFMLKSTSCVVGPGECVRRPQGVERLDWEVELAVIIGHSARNVPVTQALRHVAGYTVANDLSARDRTFRDAENPASLFRLDWLGQKTFDGACPLGPAITPASSIADVQKLALKLWVNDELMQSSNTAGMVFGVAELVSHLSHRVSLWPGDVILTGTPAGVGAARQRFLQPGDRVRQWIEDIGEFEFTIGAAAA
ncbi:MAG: fumarylacetoacetate hydrolase family protein [Rubrivivax sp.]|nr:fumarylacetoacetate hydrolase family protein [Burkholderiales bacterium]MCW5635384.1 fumarylacetoacetate hydrolase family protein [Rubrivivax sp.]